MLNFTSIGKIVAPWDEKTAEDRDFCHIFKYGALVGIKAHTFPYWVKFGVKV